MQNPLKDLWQGPACPSDGAAWKGILCFYDRVAVVNLEGKKLIGKTALPATQPYDRIAVVKLQSMNLTGRTVSPARLAVPSGCFENQHIVLCSERILLACGNV